MNDRRVLLQGLASALHTQFHISIQEAKRLLLRRYLLDKAEEAQTPNELKLVVRQLVKHQMGEDSSHTQAVDAFIKDYVHNQM